MADEQPPKRAIQRIRAAVPGRGSATRRGVSLRTFVAETETALRAQQVTDVQETIRMTQQTNQQKVGGPVERYYDPALPPSQLTLETLGRDGYSVLWVPWDPVIRTAIGIVTEEFSKHSRSGFMARSTRMFLLTSKSGDWSEVPVQVPRVTGSIRGVAIGSTAIYARRHEPEWGNAFPYVVNGAIWLAAARLEKFYARSVISVFPTFIDAVTINPPSSPNYRDQHDRVAVLTIRAAASRRHREV